MLNLKRHSENDIESLIESMLRLIDYMNANPGFKRKIFESFNQDDLNKILKNLYDKNATLRKASCIFLCTILQNEKNCQHFIQLTDLIPTNSKIALNSIPEKMSKTMSFEFLQKLNTVQPMDSSLCWYYSTQMAKDQVPNLAYFVGPIKEIKKSVNDFIDPQDCLIGINYQRTDSSGSHSRSPEVKKPNISPPGKRSPILYNKENPSKIYTNNTDHQYNHRQEQKHKQSDYTTDKMNIYDILKHRMSDNQRNGKSPVIKKNSNDWKSIEQKQKLNGLKI